LRPQGGRRRKQVAGHLLQPRQGSALLYGSGVSCLGPADRYLFQLTGDRAHLDGAISWADRAGLPLWQVALRLDAERAGFAGTGFMQRQARGIARGTDLVRLFDDGR